MSAASADGAGVSGLEQIVADYLRQHPDFFMRHGDLVGEMEVLHPCGRAVSLIEYQVTVLRDQSHQLRRRLQDLLVTARENEQLSERVHGLTLDLVACRTLPEALQTLYRALRASFGAEHAAVRLFAAPAQPADAALPEVLGPEERSRRLLAPILGMGTPLCGRVPAEQARALFGEAGDRVRSAALLPLGGAGRTGVLAIGSSDEARYQPGMATTFLRQLADVAREVMQRFLVLPADQVLGGEGGPTEEGPGAEASAAEASAVPLP